LLSQEEIRRLEQVWLVLSDLYQDLSRKNIYVDVAPELRNCKSLIYFIRMNILQPSIKELTTINDSLRSSSQILAKIKRSLISAAQGVGENYAKDWTNKIDKAERAELDYTMIHTVSSFVPGLPKDLEKGWIRLTLPKPIAEERVQDVAEQFGVIIEFEDDFHIVVRGRKTLIKKVAQDIHDLSLG
jgi:hypothetical protein